jgi:hypothetical protein
MDHLRSLLPNGFKVILTDFGLVRGYINTRVATYAGSPSYMGTKHYPRDSP